MQLFPAWTSLDVAAAIASGLCAFPSSLFGSRFLQQLRHNMEYGEVLEIDDGLKPYYFVRANRMTVLPIPFFAVDMVKKSEVCNESQYDPPPGLF